MGSNNTTNKKIKLFWYFNEHFLDKIGVCMIELQESFLITVSIFNIQFP